MAEALPGGCLCGAVRYAVTGPYANPSLCHCSMCRKAAGAPYIAFLTVPRARFRLTAGPYRLYRSSDKAQRGFCPNCGTTLTWESTRRQDALDVSIATLDDPAAVPPVDQIWCDDAISWTDTTPALPRHPRERNG